MRKRIVLSILSAVSLAGAVLAVQPVNKTLLGGLAVDGYDAVAYFEEGRAVEGSAEHAVEWNGAVWRFASEAHRAQFAAAPERYAPQYGGYCAWAVAHDYTADADPEAWAIVDGKLYLNYNRTVLERWSAEKEGWIAAGDRNWPRLVAEE